MTRRAFRSQWVSLRRPRMSAGVAGVAGATAAAMVLATVLATGTEGNSAVALGSGRERRGRTSPT